MRINEKYRYHTTPCANEKAIVCGEKYRFTILTSKLIRIEYNENSIFEDRATQTVINRNFPVPDFSVENIDDTLIIKTKDVELTYYGGEFTQNSLKCRYLGENSSVSAGGKSTSWHYNEETSNLGGTARTLDRIDGACELDKGIVSKGSIEMLDDSKSLIICEDGWIEPRSENLVDAYLFCYGDSKKIFDAPSCLKDFYALTGNPPLLPRYALGNWWSRYYPYSQEEYINLMKRFKNEDIPFSVAVIDMDWHYVRIDKKYGSGWTGYTWNKELFPDHTAFLKTLHNEGLKTSLNLHPQQGVSAHEKPYKNMAEAMGIDPETEKNVPFEIENQKFVENYFKHLHHPLEDEGVDFWWIDWQQGNTTKIKGLDPLWMLNHFHYIDNERNGTRGLILSRYSGPGSHRYPVGFSGDSCISWNSLDFQPYFTANASNIGYCFWSHDIGGHFNGYRDEEMITRWYQLGTFSPINRLHSSNSLFQGKEPWKYNKISEISMKKFLKLRHELIPYLYTMNYRASEYGEPLIQPLYYKVNAYKAYDDFKNEFFFGTEMLVSPITSPCDNETKRGSVKTYLPEGIWYDFFNNVKYSGDKTITVYRDLYEMPVFVKAGGIIPMAKLSHINDVENPKDMKIKVYAGDDGSFSLYEDDGISFDFKDGKYAITNLSFKWSDKPKFTISKPTGDISQIPENRNFEIEFIGIQNLDDVTVSENGKAKDFTIQNSSVSIFNVSGDIEILLNNFSLCKNDNSDRLFALIASMEQVPNDIKSSIGAIISSNFSTDKKLSEICQLDISKDVYLSLLELLTAL